MSASDRKAGDAGFSRIHRQLVDRLVQDLTPVKPSWSLARQWTAWLLLTLAAGAGLLAFLGMSWSVVRRSLSMAPWGYLVLVFGGAAVAAWMAVASSLPGREGEGGGERLGGALLAAILLVPVLIFAPEEEGSLTHIFSEGAFCFASVVAVAILPWGGLGFLLARNASFRPARTGFWAGASAFLAALGVVQTLCPNAARGHVLVAHLLPVAAGCLAAIWLGSMWFGRWKKRSRKPLQVGSAGLAGWKRTRGGSSSRPPRS